MSNYNDVVKAIRDSWPKGTEIILDEMKGERNMPRGLKGVVDFVDDAGQIHVKWENGSSLALIPNEDRYRKIAEQEKEQEYEMTRQKIKKSQPYGQRIFCAQSYFHELAYKHFTTVRRGF